jgi:hypothetical protein
MSYIAEIETRVAGIPCIIGVNEYQKGSYDYWEDSSDDYYGCCDWEVCDRKGRHAAWLERKIDNKERAKINELVSQYFSNQGAEYDY